MSLKFLVSTVGKSPDDVGDELTERLLFFEKNDLLKWLPQMLKSMDENALVRQIEDPDHPLNGWEIGCITISWPPENMVEGDYEVEYSEGENENV
jgi:hypothetical protein